MFVLDMHFKPIVMVIVLYTPIVCWACPNVKHSTLKNLLRPNGLAYLLFASLTKKEKKVFGNEDISIFVNTS